MNNFKESHFFNACKLLVKYHLGSVVVGGVSNFFASIVRSVLNVLKLVKIDLTKKDTKIIRWAENCTPKAYISCALLSNRFVKGCNDF